MKTGVQLSSTVPRDSPRSPHLSIYFSWNFWVSTAPSLSHPMPPQHMQENTISILRTQLPSQPPQLHRGAQQVRLRPSPVGLNTAQAGDEAPAVSARVQSSSNEPGTQPAIPQPKEERVASAQPIGSQQVTPCTPGVALCYGSQLHTEPQTQFREPHETCDSAPPHSKHTP